MTALMSRLINDLDKAMKTKSNQKPVWFVIVVYCQSGYLCHQQNKQVVEGCLCNKGQAAVQ